MMVAAIVPVISGPPIVVTIGIGPANNAGERTNQN